MKYEIQAIILDEDEINPNWSSTDFKQYRTRWWPLLKMARHMSAIANPDIITNDYAMRVYPL